MLHEEESNGSEAAGEPGMTPIEHDFFNQSTSLLVTHGERRKDYVRGTEDEEQPEEVLGPVPGLSDGDDEARGDASLLPSGQAGTQPAESASSFAGAVFNLANSTIGAGALGTVHFIPSPTMQH